MFDGDPQRRKPQEAESISATALTNPTATKIVATLGPATADDQTIEQLLRAGVDVVRLNFSHGTRDEHRRAVEAVRSISQRLDRATAIMGDLCGPKVRLAEIEGGSVRIETGAELRFVTQSVVGNAERLTINHPEILDEIQVGHRLLIDDGAIRLCVTARGPDGLVCDCLVGGKLSTRKGVNLPDTDLSLPTLTAKDLDDLAWAAEAELDYIALSFVRQAADIEDLRRRLTEIGSAAHVLAKIETRQAINDLEAIVTASDGVLIARGDLGVEVDVATVPRLQKEIADLCRRAGKPVIVATQMLQSMVESPVPTRAEVSDVANAIYDGADALLLSAETAIGRYPIRAVEMLGHVARETEAHDQTRRIPLKIGLDPEHVAAAVARSLANVADDVKAAAVVVWTESGRLARLVGKHRLDRPVIGLTSTPTTLRRLALYYGVIPMLAPKPAQTQDLLAAAERATACGWAKPGDLIIIGCGPRSLIGANTGSIVIHTVRDR
ncbi:MAG: pyruvate kinase [Planctomycetes bacterium]|nr:pyruvate kinase [Planctomycetota bacterium]